MEVGIDLGDLTAVALRNVPPDPQTINNVLSGRGVAGRVAMTHIDNNAYAMAQFERPENITAAPEPRRTSISTT